MSESDAASFAWVAASVAASVAANPSVSVHMSTACDAHADSASDSASVTATSWVPRTRLAYGLAEALECADEALSQAALLTATQTKCPHTVTVYVSPEILKHAPTPPTPPTPPAPPATRSPPAVADEFEDEDVDEDSERLEAVLVNLDEDTERQWQGGVRIADAHFITATLLYEHMPSDFGFANLCRGEVVTFKDSESFHDLTLSAQPDEGPRIAQLRVTQSVA